MAGSLSEARGGEKCQIPLRHIDINAFERVNPDWNTKVQRTCMTSSLAWIVAT
jgi:hypothetical protein